MILNLLTVFSLLYLGNASRDIEKKNSELVHEIELLNEQIKINEIEYALYSNYTYLKKLQKIYFNADNLNMFENNRISFFEINNNIEDIYKVGTRQ